MPQISLMPMPRQQFFDNSGRILAGGSVYTALPGTFAGPGQAYPQATYTDLSGNTLNSNPIILDSAGRGSIWLSGFCKVAVYDALGNLVYTQDNVSSAAMNGMATYADAASGPVTVNLPSSGEVIITKTDATTNAVTIVATGGKTILRQASIDLTTQDESMHLMMNGTNWYRI